MSDNYLPPAAPRENEGNTRAAWFAMTLIMIGSAIIGLGMVVNLVALIVAGAVVIVLGLVGGYVLRKAGHGQPLDG